MEMVVTTPSTRTAKELRKLAQAIENHTLQAPCMSVAMPIVRHCVDHLCLLARLHELNAAPPRPQQP
jgi:hypothetical protein